MEARKADKITSIYKEKLKKIDWTGLKMVLVCLSGNKKYFSN
jgi:hypothetical protein